ncbi:MAG: septum formation initiator family protein [Lachnospiraceae bacterium]|nr:septum formation initiator family protein [Lachnospiraceae bacterium]
MFTYNGMELRKQKKELERDTAQMEVQLEQEKQRAVELKEFETYTHTKKYAEEVAKEKLGYVYEGEIIFQKDR